MVDLEQSPRNGSLLQRVMRKRMWVIATRRAYHISQNTRRLHQGGKKPSSHVRLENNGQKTTTTMVYCPRFHLTLKGTFKRTRKHLHFQVLPRRNAKLLSQRGIVKLRTNGDTPWEHQKTHRATNSACAIQIPTSYDPSHGWATRVCSYKIPRATGTSMIQAVCDLQQPLPKLDQEECYAMELLCQHRRYKQRVPRCIVNTWATMKGDGVESGWVMGRDVGNEGRRGCMAKKPNTKTSLTL